MFCTVNCHSYPELPNTLTKKGQSSIPLLLEFEKNLHTTPNSQGLIDNLAIEESLKYATLALDGELQAWADAMDEDWCP